MARQTRVSPSDSTNGNDEFPFGANAEAATDEAGPALAPSDRLSPGESQTDPLPARPQERRPQEAAEQEPEVEEVEQPEAETEQTQPSDAPDPFDPASLRLSQDFATAAGVKRVLLSVPVRKPADSWWIRVHPDKSYRLQTAVIALKEDRETYLVAPALWPDLATEVTFKPKLLVTAINRQGVLFLWILNLPRTDGRVDEWTRTALDAANCAQKVWVRVTANMNLGAYDLDEAKAQFGEPVWPDIPFKELLRIAFKGRLIDSLDHPKLRQLRGEV